MATTMVEKGSLLASDAAGSGGGGGGGGAGSGGKAPAAVSSAAGGNDTHMSVSSSSAAAGQTGGGGTSAALRVPKTLKREAESLWDVPPDTYGSRACARLSVPAQLVAVAVLGSFQFGYNLAALNTSKAFVVLDFGWCKREDGGHYIGCDKGLLYGSLVTTAVFVGAAIGCLVGGKVTEFGRRMALLGTHCLCIMGSGLSAGAEGFVSLLLARLVVGVSVGLFTVAVPMYIAEVTPDSSRGFFGTFHQLLITIGIFFGTVLGLAFGEAPADKTVYVISTFQQTWWRVLLGFPMLVSLVAVILYLWVFPFETPHYMLEKKQRAKAAALLREIYGREDVDTEMHRLLQSHYEMKIQRAQQLNLWKALVHHAAYRHVIIIACLLSMFQQFSGINVLVANSNNLYVSLKLPSSTITGLSVGFAALNVVLTIITVPLVDTLGRRTLLLFSMVVQFVAMAVAFVANLVDQHNTAVQWTTVACVYVFIVGFAVGYGPILWIYLHEIFPPEIKQGAAGLASALNWVATVCIVLPSDFLLNSSFTVFVGLCTGALLFILIVTLIFVKETKGLSIEDSPYFKGKHRAVSGSAFVDKLSPSFFYGQQRAEEGTATAAFRASAAASSLGAGGAANAAPAAAASSAHPLTKPRGKASAADLAPPCGNSSSGSDTGVGVGSSSGSVGEAVVQSAKAAAPAAAGAAPGDAQQQQQKRGATSDDADTSVAGMQLRVPRDAAPAETSPGASDSSAPPLAHGEGAADTAASGPGGAAAHADLAAEHQEGHHYV